MSAVAAVVVASASFVAPLTAKASGFALLEQSASRLGTAFAGTAAMGDDATAIFFNAAGLTQLEGMQAIVVASGIEITSEFRDRGSLPALGQPLGNTGGDAGEWNFVPAAYFATPIGERLALGLGVTVPFGLKLEYQDGWIGRFQSLNNEIETVNVNPTLAWRVTDRISVGIGANYQRIDAELTNAVNYSAVIVQGVSRLVALGQLPGPVGAQVINTNPGLEGHARVRGDDEAWGYNIGLLFDLTDSTQLGLSYRSKMDYSVRGTITFTAPAVTNPVAAGIVSAASVVDGPLSTGPASVDLELPDMALLSLRQRIGERFELLADVGWTGWSSIQELRVVRPSGVTASVTPEKWDDAWRYAVGGTYKMSDPLTFRAGLAFDQTPVPDETRTPRLPDPDRTWAAIGLRWEPAPSFVLDFGYAHLFSDTVPLHQDAGNAQLSGLLDGRQESNVNIVSTQLTYRF